jgi:hypothetical protein
VIGNLFFFIGVWRHRKRFNGRGIAGESSFFSVEVKKKQPLVASVGQSTFVSEHTFAKLAPKMWIPGQAWFIILSAGIALIKPSGKTTRRPPNNSYYFLNG